MESVGFKEWAVVCEALGQGRQSIILRKGGIAEGRDGFSFKHKDFFLFPTWFHEQPQKVREFESRLPEQNAAMIQIRYAGPVELSRTIKSWDVAEALAPLHILQPDVVRERFDYDEAPGVHVAYVRVSRLEPQWSFPNEKNYGGCRSWVPLPELPNNTRLEPVLTDAAHNRRLDEFVRIVDSDKASGMPSPQSSP
ncbi:MAG TPA: DUF1802 family protein [Chthoniobacterales bacterium]|jgi:hypothetical protein